MRQKCVFFILLLRRDSNRFLKAGTRANCGTFMLRQRQHFRLKWFFSLKQKSSEIGLDCKVAVVYLRDHEIFHPVAVSFFHTSVFGESLTPHF